MNTKKFDQSLIKIKEELDEENNAREEIIQKQRRIIRISSEAIKSVHRKEFTIVDKKIADAQKLLIEMRELMSDLSILGCWRGINDAEQELGEAIITRAIVKDDEIPSLEECGIQPISYLLALSDVIGEMRRYLMDSLRVRDFENAQRAFDYMDFIYSELMTVDYTKMLVGHLRSKVDVGRNLVHRSRSDLITSTQSYELKKTMDTLIERLEQAKKG